MLNPLDREQLLPRLERAGFRFSKGLGQNFVTAPWVPETLAEAAGCGKNTAVLEVGPGAGALTRCLAHRAGSVTAVEKDERILPVLREAVEDFDNVRIVLGDVLKLDLRALAEAMPEKEKVAAANLPYSITTQAVEALVAPDVFSRVAVMVQREAADRLLSRPGDRDWCLAAARVGWRYEGRRIREVPPDCFVPAPHVVSEILCFDRLEAPRVPVRDEAAFLKVLSAAFFQRRKTFANSAAAALGIGKERVSTALLEAGLSPTVRGEALDYGELARITDALER